MLRVRGWVCWCCFGLILTAVTESRDLAGQFLVSAPASVVSTIAAPRYLRTATENRPRLRLYNRPRSGRLTVYCTMHNPHVRYRTVEIVRGFCVRVRRL